MSTYILHITSKAAWQAAQAEGKYSAPSLASEGFIHCSTAAQAAPVAERFYKGQKGLVLLLIDPDHLRSVLKWEPPSDAVPLPGVPAGAAFPHIYGPINLDAVVRVLDYEPSADGRFVLPELL